MKPLGIYLHIPFCRSKCRYCDFCSFPAAKTDSVQAYIDRLCKEIADRKTDASGYTVDTVYFGGGTPTLLNAAQFESVLTALYQNFSLADDCEITAECNPATGGVELFSAMRKMGFNRLSVGLQSANPNELRALGRLHDLNGFLQTWNQARQAGFENMSADLMFGIPDQTPESFQNTLKTVTALAPQHLSVYALTLEEGTPLYKNAANYRFPGEEETADMYLQTVEFLAAHGLEQYEISNFARPGYQSRHNCKYWNVEEYLGFGVAAHSDFRGVRFANGRDLNAYLQGKTILAERSEPTPAERENEYVMLQMRLVHGLEEAAFYQRFGHSAAAFFKRLEPWVAKGFVRRTKGGMAFTPAGFLVSNPILAATVDFPS